MIKVISAALVGGILTFGAGEIMEDPKIVDATADKQAILRYYIDAQVRLNEIPTLDLSIISADEMSQASIDLATEKDVLTKENLFEALHDKAVEEGVACR